MKDRGPAPPLLETAFIHYEDLPFYGQALGFHTDINSLKPPSNLGWSYYYYSFFTEEEMRPTEVPPQAQGHTTHRWQSWDLNPGRTGCRALALSC